MTSKSIVERAHKQSRVRAIFFAVATLYFLGLQFVTRPAFTDSAYAHGWRLYAWALNAVLLLLCLATGGGLLRNTQIRALMNDELSRANYRTSCITGFWVAISTSLVIFVVPALQTLTGHQAGYLVITIATVTAMLTFSWLEYRSLADA
jgi:VanZ family protein